MASTMAMQRVTEIDESNSKVHRYFTSDGNRRSVLCIDGQLMNGRAKMLAGSERATVHVGTQILT
ncbi:hypothetical protein ACP70R_017625 [Stipagrostis hirtigluma subsp. patula]